MLNDQGRRVRVRWHAIAHDVAGSDTVITAYSVWRRVDAYRKAGGAIPAENGQAKAHLPQGERLLDGVFADVLLELKRRDEPPVAAEVASGGGVHGAGPGGVGRCPSGATEPPSARLGAERYASARRFLDFARGVWAFVRGCQ